MHNMRVWIKFYLGQNEDYSLGDNTSGSSEKLLHGVGEEGQYICNFDERRVPATKHIFFFSEGFC